MEEKSSKNLQCISKNRDTRPKSIAAQKGLGLNIT